MYSNNTFSPYEYAFSNFSSYSSIKLIQHKNYSVEDTSITSQDIQNLLQRVKIVDEPSDIPFPQADKNNGTYTLTAAGRKILSMSWKNKQFAFCERILSHKVFHELLTAYFDAGCLLCANEIIAVMKSSALHNVSSNETFKRRSSTIQSWLNWITSLITE